MNFIVVNSKKIIKTDLCLNDISELYKQFGDNSTLSSGLLPRTFYETLPFVNNIYEYQTLEIEKKFAKWTYEKAKHLYNRIKKQWTNGEDIVVVDISTTAAEEEVPIEHEPTPTSIENESISYTVSSMNDDKFNQFNVFRKRRTHLSETYYEGFEKEAVFVEDNQVESGDQLMLTMYNSSQFAIIKSNLNKYLHNLESMGMKDIKIDYVWYFPNVNIVYDLAEFYQLDTKDFLPNIFKIYKVIAEKQNKGIFYKWFLEYAYTNYEFDYTSSIDFYSFYKHFMESNSKLNFILTETNVRDIMLHFNMHIKDQKILHLKKLAKPRSNTSMNISEYKLMTSKPKITQLRTDPGIIVDSKNLGPWLMSSKLEI